MGWVDAGGFRTPDARLDSTRGPAATSGVRSEGQRSLVFARRSGGSGFGVASQKTGPVAGDVPRFARQHRISVRKEPRYQRLRRFRFDHPPTARPDANCRRVSRPLDPGSDSRGTPEFGVASTARSSPEHMDFIACWIESVSPCGVSQEIVSSARRVLTLRLLHIDEQAASAASSRWHRNFKRICFRNVPARTIGIRS